MTSLAQPQPQPADTLPADTVGRGCAFCVVSGGGYLLVCTERCDDSTRSFTPAERVAILAAAADLRAQGAAAEREAWDRTTP